MMLLDEYQKRAGKTDASPHEDWYYALGLNGEAGEVAELVKKLHRQHGEWKGVKPNDDLYRQKMCYELGDVLWYLARMASSHGLTLEQIADANLNKLAERYRALGTSVVDA